MYQVFQVVALAVLVIGMGYVCGAVVGFWKV